MDGARIRTGWCVPVIALALVAMSGWAADASAAPATETLVGTASISHAPKRWDPSSFYLQICPVHERFSMQCSGQQSGSPDQTTGAFSVTLPAAAWNVGMYYYTANGQIILNKGLVVAARPGATFRKNVSMAYVVPAAEGTVGLTGAPGNFDSLGYMVVQACPARVSFDVGCKGGEEAYESVAPGSHYLIDLHRGVWDIAAYYWADDNSRNFTGTPVPFTARANSTRLVNVSMAYQGI